jgi:hypothetical protein
MLSGLGLWLSLSITASAQEPPSQARADTSPTAAELALLGAQLGSASKELRAQAHDVLLGLGEDAIPAIRSELTELRRRLDLDAAMTAMTDFRRVQGVSSPAAEVDLQKGVLQVLEKQRSRGTTDAAELLLLLRALEAQKTPLAASVILADLVALAPKLFRYELPRTRQRLGPVILPALVRHQNHAHPWIRDFCRTTLLDMRMDTPGRAVQQDDVILLSALLDAYGDTLTFDAMPVVVSFLTDERAAVRQAARRAVQRFGRNAIWQLRERYLNATGLEAEASWGWKRLLDELYALHDGPKQRDFEARLAEAQAALDAAEDARAQAALDQAINVLPAKGEAAGPLYGRLADRHLEAERLPEALAAYRRAARLAPNDPAATRFRSRVRFIEAELRLYDGIVDLDGYRSALVLDPSFERARAQLDLLTGERAARERRQRQLAGLAAAVLLLAAALFLLRRPTSAVAVDSDVASDEHEDGAGPMATEPVDRA